MENNTATQQDLPRSINGHPVTTRSASKLVALSQLDSDLTELATLDAQASTIEKRAKYLKDAVKESMNSIKIDKYETPTGIKATMYITGRSTIDRAAVEKLLTPEQFATVCKSSTTIALRIS